MNDLRTNLAYTKMSYFNLLLIIFLGWLTSGCGASMTTTDSTAGSSSSSSFMPLSTSFTSLSTQNTICNEISTANIRLDAKLRIVDGTDDMMRVRITGLTNQFDNGANTNLQMYRWTASTDGTTSMDSAPLTFHIEAASSNGHGGNIYTQNMTQIAMSDVTTIAKNNALTINSAESFFNQVDVIVHGVSIDWKALKFVIYNNGAILVSNDALLPAFAANPSTYASNHPSVLSSLHPFHTQLGLNDSDYLSMAQSFCF